MVKDTQYIISFNVNEQLMIKVQKMHKVKESSSVLWRWLDQTNGLIKHETHKQNKVERSSITLYEKIYELTFSYKKCSTIFTFQDFRICFWIRISLHHWWEYIGSLNFLIYPYKPCLDVCVQVSMTLNLLIKNCQAFLISLKTISTSCNQTRKLTLYAGRHPQTTCGLK